LDGLVKLKKYFPKGYTHKYNGLQISIQSFL